MCFAKNNRRSEPEPFVQRGFSLIESRCGRDHPHHRGDRDSQPAERTMAANEAAAAVTVITITTASMTYSSTYGNGFPPSLAVMGGPPAGPATCNQAVLLDEIITTAPNQKSGFKFAFTAVGPPVVPPVGCGAPGSNAYLVAATPVTEGLTGIRSFCSDEPGTIHFDVSGATPTTQAECEALPVLQ